MEIILKESQRVKEIFMDC